MTTMVAENHEIIRRPTVMGELSERYRMDPVKLLETIRATCIKGNASNEQVQAFLLVANRYGLDPFLKEIHAFAQQGGGIVPIVGIDGWSKIANSTGKLDGIAFNYDGEGPALACEATVYVKGREHPVVVTEYLAECKRNTPPWNQYPRRMLRHRAFIQAVRLAFGFGGIYDEDEARDIVNNGASMPAVAARPDLKARLAGPVADPDTQLPEHELVATAVSSPSEPAPEPETASPAGAGGEDAPMEAAEQGDEPTWSKIPLKDIDEAVRDFHPRPKFASVRAAREKFHSLHAPKSWDELEAHEQHGWLELLKRGEVDWT